MGRGWQILQTWIDEQPAEIKPAALARALGFAQSNFDVWKKPKSLPSREAIGAIARLTGRSFFEVRDAFLEDIGYNTPPTDAEISAARSHRKGPPKSEDQHKLFDSLGEESQDDGGMEPA